MYFVHSFYPKPADPSVVLTVTRYGPTTFCSTVQQQNVMACQYHPERSGPQGLQIYRNLAALVSRSVTEVKA
jgi:glutamine amidotransferase